MNFDDLEAIAKPIPERKPCLRLSILTGFNLVPNTSIVTMLEYISPLYVKVRVDGVEYDMQYNRDFEQVCRKEMTRRERLGLPECEELDLHIKLGKHHKLRDRCVWIWNIYDGKCSK